jgi:hypothetical protein
MLVGRTLLFSVLAHHLNQALLRMVKTDGNTHHFEKMETKKEKEKRFMRTQTNQRTNKQDKTTLAALTIMAQGEISAHAGRDETSLKKDKVSKKRRRKKYATRAGEGLWSLDFGL